MNWIRVNWRYRIIAIVLAFFTWYLVSGREKVETWIEIPVEFVNLPRDLVLVKGAVTKIEVRVRGTRGLIRSLKERLVAYPMDLKRLKKGENQFSLEARKLRLPGAVEVMETKPQRVVLFADQVAIKSLPVRVVLAGNSGLTTAVSRAMIVPASVQVTGAESKFEQLTSIPTTPIIVQGAEQPLWEGLVPLAPPQDVKIEPNQVTVRLLLKPKTKEVTLKVPLQVRVAKKWKVEVSEMTIRVMASLPVAVLENQSWREQIKAQLVVPPEAQAGVHTLKVDIYLPDWGRLLDVKPQTIQLRLSPQ